MATKLTITIETQPEDETPEQSEKRTRSADGYAKCVREQMKTAEGCWGWCVVKITAKNGSKTGTAYLGNCSYESAQNFIKTSGYFQQMVEEAVQETLK